MFSPHALDNISDDQQLMLLDVAANPVLKNMILQFQVKVGEDLLSLDPNGRNFRKTYRKLQQEREFLEGFQMMLSEVLNRFSSNQE